MKRTACCNLLTFTVVSLLLSVSANAELILHEYPDICPKSQMYSVKLNGRDASVYLTSASSFVSYESDEPVDVEIQVAERFRPFRILPLRLKIEPEITDQTIRFTMPPAEKAYLEIALDERLLIYGNPIEKDKPDPNAPGMHYFRAGQVYEVGEIVLRENETVYVEGGAVMRGQVRGTRVNNVKVAGLGVIDSGFYKRPAGGRQSWRQRPRQMLFEDCRNVRIEDVILIEPRSWMITLYYCDAVEIDNVKELAQGKSTDGIDIVCSHNVKMTDCIIKNGDDGIVIKAFKNRYRTYCNIEQNTHLRGVENVLVTGCALETNLGGSVFEFGHELLENPIRDVKFADCDVLGAHDHGGVFGIHNADDAHVEDIVWENIRVDHYYEKLFDLRIVKSRYSESEERGAASDILFKDIYVTVLNANPGYSLSHIGGYDEDHKITNVTFDNVQLNGVKATSIDDLDLYVKHAENIVVK